MKNNDGTTTSQKQKKKTEEITFSPGLLKLDLDKINEFIGILEEKEKNLESENKFAEASKIREKIAEFEHLKIYKMETEMKKEAKSKINTIRSEKENELKSYNEMSTQQRNEINEKAQQMEKEMKERHEKELEEYKVNFENNWPPNNPTSTREMLELQKKLDTLIKKKQYSVAQKYQDKYNELKEKNDIKWNKEIKLQKLNAEIKRITTKQNNELNALRQKIQSINNEFDQQLQKDIEIIHKKYKNKERESLNECNIKKDQKIITSRKIINKNDYNTIKAK